MKVTFNWIGGATCILTIDNIKLAIDPVLCPKGTEQDYFWFKSKRIEDPVFAVGDFDAIELWLITHNHEDHIDAIGISVISKSSKVICNGNALKKLKNKGLKMLTCLNWHDSESFNIDGYTVTIKAIPAIHGVNPLSAFFAGKVNGYYISVSKGKENLRIYFTGDTVFNNKTIKAISEKEIDILIPNMGAAKKGSWVMTLTLDAKMLKKMIALLNPKLVIPVHHGTFEHYVEPIEKTIALQEDRIKIVKPGSKTYLGIFK